MSIEFKENPLLVTIQDVFRRNAPGWILKNAIYSDETRVYSEWQSQNDEVVVQVAMMSSLEAAETNLRLFDSRVSSKGNASLPDLGDENHVWHKSDELRSTVIKFRTGHAVVQISGSDLEVSVSLARALAESLRSTPE